MVASHRQYTLLLSWSTKNVLIAEPDDKEHVTVCMFRDENSEDTQLAFEICKYRALHFEWQFNRS